MRWLAAILLLLAPAAEATRWPDVEGDQAGLARWGEGRLDCPGRLGNYGFGSCATGGTGKATYAVDTTTWVGPSDGTFDPTDCDAVGGDACNFAEAVCRAAAQGGGTVAVNVTGAIRIANSISANDGTGSSAFTLRDCPGVTASTPARNITITGENATGAGSYFTNGDFYIDAAYNVILTQLRHRGSADDGSDHSYLGAGFAVLSGELIVVDRVSIAGVQAYTGAVNTGFVGNNDQPIHRTTWSNNLLGPSTMFNRAHSASATDVFVNAGTCSTTTSQQCCVDASVTTGVGGCPGVETCVGESATECRVERVAGLCFGGLDGGADLSRGVTSCDDDSDCRGGVCAAFCSGTGTSANRRAGTNIGNGHESSANYVFNREFRDGLGTGVCYAGTRVGLPCANDGHCTGGGAGSCVSECPNATDFGSGTQGLHNFGLFVGGNITTLTLDNNLMLGSKWRHPEVSPDAFGTGSLTPNRAAQIEATRNESFAGLYQTNLWSDDVAWNRYRHDVLFYRNHHNFTAANRLLFSDILGDLIHANWEIASFNTTQDSAANARYYFKDNLDRFHSVGAGTCSTTTTTDCCVDGDCPGVETCVGESTSCELCEDGVGLGCGPAKTDCDSFSTNFTDAGTDCTYETGATVSDSKYAGPRDPWTKIPTPAATHAAERTARLATVGATLPCQDGVDELVIREVTAGRSLRINSDRLEIGGPQTDMSTCPDDVVNTAPTCGSVNRNFASGSGWVSWTQTVTNADAGPLTMFCYIDSAGTVEGQVYNRTACADGTVEGVANLTGKPDGSYPISYYADDGEDRTLCTFNLIMP